MKIDIVLAKENRRDEWQLLGVTPTQTTIDRTTIQYDPQTGQILSPTDENILSWLEFWVSGVVSRRRPSVAAGRGDTTEYYVDFDLLRP